MQKKSIKCYLLVESVVWGHKNIIKSVKWWTKQFPAQSAVVTKHSDQPASARKTLKAKLYFSIQRTFIVGDYSRYLEIFLRLLLHSSSILQTTYDFFYYPTFFFIQTNFMEKSGLAARTTSPVRVTTWLQ